MFRTSPTRILLSDDEVDQTLQSIWDQKFMTLNLSYCNIVSEEEEKEKGYDEDEAEYYQDSLSTSYIQSSLAGYTMSEYDRYACELLKRYRDMKIYKSSSTSDSGDLPEYPAGPHATLDTRSVDPGENYQTDGAYRDVMEIPDSQTSSASLIESSTETSPPATIILSPRSPGPTPRARRVSRMHRSGYYGNLPVLQVRVPSVYEQISDMVMSDSLFGGAGFHELIWQTGPLTHLLRDTYSRLPLGPDQQANWNRYMLAQPPKDKSSTMDTKAQSTKWSKENTRSRTHRQTMKKSLVLEVID